LLSLLTLLLMLLVSCLLCCVVSPLPVASSAGTAPALLPAFICFCTYTVS
jgi:hypothetical protein